MRRSAISIATPWLAAALAALSAPGCDLDPLPAVQCDLIECNDGNPCTEDRCNPFDGTCQFEVLIAGTVCDTGDACDGVATCTEDGACISTDPIDTGDGDPCTEDICDPLTGVVTHPPIQGCMVTDPGWQPLPTTGAPSPRWLHVGLWTGTEMLIWGGKPGAGAVSGDGALYDPTTDTWRPMSMTGAPAARHSPSAVWTGSEMIVWGGFGQSSYLTDGARYDPATDTWTPITSVGAPTGRTFQGTAWTGTEMVLWGGSDGPTPLGDGARYNPTADSWTSLPAAGAPSPRLKPSATWTGSEVVFWGGTNTFDWLNSGARFNPATGLWSGATTTQGVLLMRETHTAVWTGDRVAVWGGWDGGNFLNDGALYDPVGNSWSPMAATGAPSNRAKHTATWTGDAMFVWGGCAGQTCESGYRETGGIWRPLGGPEGGWSPVVANDNLSARSDHIAVWTGTEIIIWGGYDGDELGDGARATIDEL